MDDEREDQVDVQEDENRRDEVDDGLQADSNGDRFAQGGGGKIYRDGVLVTDLDGEDDE